MTRHSEKLFIDNIFSKTFWLSSCNRKIQSFCALKVVTKELKFFGAIFDILQKKRRKLIDELQSENVRLRALHLNARLNEELRASVTAHAALLTTPGVAAPRRERILGDAYPRRRHRHTGSLTFFPFLLLSFFLLFWCCAGVCSSPFSSSPNRK